MADFNREILHGEKEFIAWIGRLCAASSQVEVAAQIGVKPNYLSSVLHGRGSLGAKLLARFGYRAEKSTIYVPIEPKEVSHVEPETSTLDTASAVGAGSQSSYRSGGKVRNHARP
jgi:hypothetical protein